MPSCELCGKETDSVKKAKIEGAVLRVCESCASIGEDLSQKSTRKKKKKRRTPKKRGSDEVLIPKYGEKLKEARESDQLSIKEVANDLNEKESLISKIEKQELKPDKTLAKKLSDKFNITLYTNPEVSDYGAQDRGNQKKATLGDVADID